MAKLTEIEATYRVVTPLFCAGADQQRAEIRLPSFKGVLRFWWRALAWSRLNGNLKKIQQEENMLFGSADGGQSRVSMHLALVSDSQMVSKDTVLTVSETNGRVVGEGARYLGYGIMEAFDGKKTRAGRLTRACLREPIDFTVHIRLRKRGLSTKEYKQYLASLEKALIVSGTLGGMGAKSRKGYGSLAIRSLRINGEEQWSLPKSKNDLCNVIEAFRSNIHTKALPEFTALSTNARHVLLSSYNREPLELLDLIGRELVRYRSWGHHGKVLGHRSERNFRNDHDLMKIPYWERKRHPSRIAFGLPHNYGRGKTNQVEPSGRNLDRRASPLFIHIDECGGSAVAVLSFLPGRFLPKGNSGISVGGRPVSQVPEEQLYKPIHQFLNRLLDTKKRKEAFTEVMEVRL